MGINLTNVLFGGLNSVSCRNFATIIPNTVTGNSDTADYKDTVLFPFPDISNCGTVTVKKAITPFADAYADDLFVDRLFRAEDIDIVDTAPVVVVASANAAGLLASFRRTFRGNRAIGDLAATDRAGTRATVRDLGRLARRGPTELVDAAVYAAVVTWARVLAWGHSRTSRVWERDDTSRR